MQKLLPEAIVICAILMVVSYGFAQTWTKKTGAFALAESIAISADGRIIMSVGSDSPVVSTNWGSAWTSPTLVYGLNHIAASSDGLKVIAVRRNTGQIYVSMDSANSWTPTALSFPNSEAIAISADGSKFFAALNGGRICESTNFGTDWYYAGPAIKAWSCLAASADGTKLATGVFNDQVYTSTNSGHTWTATSSLSNSWTSIASSTDGCHLLATGGNGTFVSTNSGGNWTQFNIFGYSAATSADGSKLMIATTGNIYTSTNFGVNWTTFTIPFAYWFSVASSADGNEMLAGGNGYIYICQTTPAPQLNLKASNTALALSWLIPSTNFLLQQSTDLVSWSSVTDTAALDLTNLNDEFPLSPSNSSGFFRLISQ